MVGGITELGSWSPASSVRRYHIWGEQIPMKLQIPLSAARYPTWNVTLYLQPGTTFEYKFVRKETDGRVRGRFT